MPAPRTYPHTAALQAVLDSTGFPVGFNQAPNDTPPYLVLYSLTAAEHDGTLADPDADWRLPYQVTCVAVGPEQAQDVVDVAVAALASAAVTVSGRHIMRVEVEQIGRIERDDTTKPSLHYGVATVAVWTTPA